MFKDWKTGRLEEERWLFQKNCNIIFQVILVNNLFLAQTVFYNKHLRFLNINIQYDIISISEKADDSNLKGYTS
jgi:hypothetical protein